VAVAVYVDDHRVPWRGDRWSHLLADTPEELHAFAARLGLPPRGFHHKPARPWKDHYDVPEFKRREAIRLGAEPIRVARAAQILRARRQALAKTPAPAQAPAASAAPGGDDSGS